MPRKEGLQYDLEHNENYFYIRANLKSSDFSIFRISIDNMNLELAEVLLKSKIGYYYEKLEVFQNHLVVWYWRNGLRNFMVLNIYRSNAEWKEVTFSVEDDVTTQVYSIFPGTNQDMEERLYRTFSTKCLFFSNSSFLQPWQFFSFDMDTFQTGLVFKNQFSSFQSSNYIQVLYNN